MPSYSDSLLLKNVLLGLTFRAHGFPSTLADAGYTDAFVEYSLTTATLKTVSYDLGVVAPERNRSLVLEMKGGTYANLPEQQRFLRQLEGYGQLTAEDVVERGGFSVAPGQDPRSHDLDVAVVGMDGAIHHLDPLVQQSTFRPPMLAVIVDPGDLTYQGMTVHHGALRDTMLSALLGPLETRYAIPLKIPFDPSSDEADIARTIMPALLSRFTPAPGGSCITSQDIAQQVIDIWHWLGPQEQEAYSGRIDRIIRHVVAAREFRGVVTWDNAAGRRCWQLEALPRQHDHRRTRFNQLQRMAEALVARLAGGAVQEPLALDSIEGDKP